MSNFFNFQLLRSMLVALPMTVIILFCCYVASTVHLPLLAVMLSGVGIGFLEPKRGWLLALAIILLVFLGAFLMKTYLPLTVKQAEHTQFVAYLTFFPAFTGGFLGSFLKRALG